MRIQNPFPVSLLIALLTLSTTLQAQRSQEYKANVSRVLFLLDVSGSMKEEWAGKKKYDVARSLLYKLIDSVERTNPNVEFAVRAFGYQSPKEKRNCRDSKLIVPFAKNNATRIREALSGISPQGMTPIAFSLLQSSNDFPADEKSLNSIIIITDGNENCDGNPCKSTKELIDKRISVRPFIVGLDVGEKNAEKFNCIGTFMDTKSDSSFYQTVGVIIKQTLNTTTTQINLLDANANPTVTNIPFTLYDHASRKILYNFVHTLNEKGNPDTLYLDPVGIYDLEIHTVPVLRKENIELAPGKHNIIAMDVPLAAVALECLEANYANNDAQAVVRSTDHKTLNVQDLNTSENYLAGSYAFELVTVPEVFFDSVFVPFSDNKLSAEQYGTISVMSGKSLKAFVFLQNQLVDRFDIAGKTLNRKLQPGKYKIVYKESDSYDSESTQSKRFEVLAGQVTVVNLIE